MKNKILFYLLNVLFFCLDSKISIDISQINNYLKKIVINFDLDKNESIYTKTININSDNPGIKLSDWKNENIILQNDILQNNFDLILNVERLNKEIDKANLFLIYFSNKENKTIEKKFEINFEKPVPETNSIETTDNLKNVSIENKNNKPINIFNLSGFVQNLLKQGQSIWFQLILVFFLGLLMSFTPCIYPVIPVTAGILKMQGSKSIWYNLALSIAYAIGIATTFASFGLAAALSGHLFGQILSHPVFVIFICSFLLYLAFSMFGFYDMYVPKFLNKSNNIKHKGSLSSAFLFGAVSGSIASPCLSPGLALLLTIVASLGSKLLGFILLFIFGIGLSVPLIIIGTFSGSINKLPRAGMWMDEVKKLFGFLLIAMSFYYLNNILSLKYMLWLVSITLFISAIYYFYDIKKYDSKALKVYKNLMGIALIIVSIFTLGKAYQKTFYKLEKQNEDTWMHDYQQAIKLTKETNKNLIIDIGASFCTLCKAIDKKVFNDPQIIEHLKDFVLLKVDATDSESEPFVSLKKKYNIIGVPTILILNSNADQLLKRFEGELYDMPKDEVIAQLIQFQ